MSVAGMSAGLDIFSEETVTKLHQLTQELLAVPGLVAPISRRDEFMGRDPFEQLVADKLMQEGKYMEVLGVLMNVQDDFLERYQVILEADFKQSINELLDVCEHYNKNLGNDLPPDVRLDIAQDLCSDLTADEALKVAIQHHVHSSIMFDADEYQRTEALRRFHEGKNLLYFQIFLDSVGADKASQQIIIEAFEKEPELRGPMSTLFYDMTHEANGGPLKKLRPLAHVFKSEHDQKRLSSKSSKLAEPRKAKKPFDGTL